MSSFKERFGIEHIVHILPEGFNVKSLSGCRIVFGKVPLSDFEMLIHDFSKKAVMSIEIADKIGASLVIGEPKDIEALSKMDLPVSPKREIDASEAELVGLKKVASWLRNGNRGISSNVMCKRMYGLPEAETGSRGHPRDPDDLRRCVKFLDETDSHDKIRLMSDVSPEWAALTEHWSELMSSLTSELSRNTGAAPKTHEMMQDILNSAQERHSPKMC